MIQPPINKFEKLISRDYIRPREIDKTYKNMAYINMNKKIYKEEELITVKENNKKKKEKEQQKKKSSAQYYDEYEDETGKIYQVPKTVNFGMHCNESFFEVYSREIVFQLFDYSILKYMQYDFKLVENDKDTKKYDINDMKKEDLKYTQEFNANPLENKKDDKKTQQPKIIKESKQKKKSKSETKIKEEKQNRNKEAIGTETDNKIENDSINEKEAIGTKTDNKIENDSINEKEEKLERFIGDFDFILPGLKLEILNKVLNNKELSPFLFHGFIDKLPECKEVDIIGEIKESFHLNLYKEEQLKKYFHMIDLFKIESNDDIQFNKFGFKANRPKIIMYVFDSTYSWFLKNMLDFKINQDKFKTYDNKYKDDTSYRNICNLFNNKINEINKNIYDSSSNETNKKKPKKTSFIQSIIDKKIPFIFLYIPDIIKSDNIKSQVAEELEKEIENLKIIVKKQQEDYEILKKKLEKIELNRIFNQSSKNEDSINKKEKNIYKENSLFKGNEKENRKVKKKDQIIEEIKQKVIHIENKKKEIKQTIMYIKNKKKEIYPIKEKLTLKKNK